MTRPCCRARSSGATRTAINLASLIAAGYDPSALRAGIWSLDLETDKVHFKEFENAGVVLFSTVVNPVRRDETYTVYTQLTKVNTKTGKPPWAGLCDTWGYTYNGVYTVYPGAGGTGTPFLIPNPDFNYTSLRANTVFRWEFKPGSTLYVVWTQQREDETSEGRFAFNQDISRMMRAPGDNVFMVKMSYWFSR